MTALAPVQPQERRILAIGLRMIAVLIFSVMMVLVKLAGEAGVKLPEIMFWRQLCALPVILVWVWFGAGVASLRSDRLPIHGRRAAMGLAGMFLNLGSVLLLPLAEATTIGFTVPLFTTIMAAILLKEQVGWQRWSAVLVGFAGVLLVVRPGANALPLFGSAVAFAAAMVVSLTGLQVRDLAKTESATTISFWFAALSVPPLALLLPWFATVHDLRAYILLVSIGMVGGLGQLALTASFRFAPASVVVGMDYVGLVWATFWGWLIWDHLPPASTWTGAPVIVAAALFIAWREHRLSLQRAKEIAA